MKKIVSIILATALIGVTCSGCGSSSSESSSEAAKEEEAVVEAEVEAETVEEETEIATESEETAVAETDITGKKYAGDIVGQGVTILDIYGSQMNYVFTETGNTFDLYNDSFTADTQIQNVETMAAAGYDGLMIYGWNQTAITTISNTISSSATPFVFFGQIPDEEYIPDLTSSEYYLGSVGTDTYVEGINAAKAAIGAGYTNAILIGGAVGDTDMDNRYEGFTTEFEAEGGNILGTARCSDSSEATTKFDDLLSAYPDADVAYCMAGDYGIAAASSLANHSDLDIAVYAANCAPDLLPYIKDGSVEWSDSGILIAVTIASALLRNNALGNKIVDENGDAPYFNNVLPFEINADNADAFEEQYFNGFPLTQEEMDALVGPDVTYEDFVNFIDTYELK